MNAAFTIVAKNYFALALTLAESIKQHQPDIDFYILLADEADIETDFEGVNHILIQAKNIDIPLYYNLAFKYSVTEFCTAVKPFFFDYLFKHKNYEKIIFFDPDVYIYNSLDGIYDTLNENDVLLTPHILTAETNYTGNASETTTLFAGIYNLGFIAIKNSNDGLKIIEWWKKRLYDLCYQDKTDALFVDQKWIDYLPGFFSNISISRYLGYNIAYWNIHEREFVKNGNSYDVTNRIFPQKSDKLVFAHFSGLNPLDIYVNKQRLITKVKNYPDWEPLLIEYSQKVIEHNYKEYLKYNYTYGEFKNGYTISHFHRRLFRRILDENAMNFNNPFATDENSFFELLSRNKLLLSKSSNLDKMNERNFKGFDNKLNKLNILMRILKRILGFDKYILLLKFCQRYFRPENQTFLIKDLEKKIKFKNENMY